MGAAKTKMAQSASSESSESPFVTSYKEHGRVNYAISCVTTSQTKKALSTASTRANHNQRRCIYCGQIAPLVWVHGHGQCVSCGINVDECCRGESCEFNQ